MATSTRTKVVGVGLVSLVFLGCEGLLGSFEIAPELTTTDDGGTNNNGDGAVQVDGSSGTDSGSDAGTDSGPKGRSCESALDCPTVAIEPAGCGIVRCIDNICTGVARDRDNDGHALAGCKVADVAVQGYASGKAIPADDCDDDDPTVFPGGECAQTEAGGTITFPNGSPVGICKRGAWSCDAGKAVCKGAVAPEATENCTLKNDANCNGVKDDGCDCITGTIDNNCGNTANLPLPCKKGTRTCVAGKWGACTGNVEPKARDCSTTVDNDCNGTADRIETACQCPGGVAQGATGACVAAAQGICADGSTKCIPSDDKLSGVFEATCTPGKPQVPDCASSKDLDCDGAADNLSVACGSPCLDSGGNKVAGVQKFTDNMWGCRGKIGFLSRASLCNTGNSEICPVKAWNEYRTSEKSKPPTRKYWVAEKLYAGATKSGRCLATTSSTFTDCGRTLSMAVCPPADRSGAWVDVDGNACEKGNCIYGTIELNATGSDFGGCEQATAGTLCCPTNL